MDRVLPPSVVISGLCLVGCVNDDIVVDVVSLPSFVSRLEVRVRLDGQDAKVLPVEPARERFVLNLPEGMQGHVALAVAGIGPSGCRESEGSTEFDFLLGQHAPTYVQVGQRITSLCPLYLSVVGEGRATSAPPGLDCIQPRCDAVFPRDTPITLSATPFLPGYVSRWSGDCSGTTETCPITLGQQKTVSVEFNPKPCTQSGGCWRVATPTSPGPSVLDALWVAPTGEVSMVEDTTVWHNKSGTWSQDKKALIGKIHAGWGTDASNVWWVGDSGRIARLSAGSWIDASPSAWSSTQLLSIWGFSPTSIWVVGDLSTILTWNGSVWRQESTDAQLPAVALRGVWGTDPLNIWAVGSGGVVMHRSADRWTSQVVAAGVEFRAVWGRDPNHVWAVGARPLNGGSSRGGHIAFFDGDKWSTQVLTSNQPINAIWGSSSRDVWAVGDGSAVFHFDGTQWQPVPWTLGVSNLIGVAGSACNNVWAISSSGAVFRYQPG